MAYIVYNGKYVTYNGKMVTAGGGSVSDSVSTNLSEMPFDGTGLALYVDNVTVSSSGTWTTSLIDTGDGTTWVTGKTPSTGGNGDTCTVSVQSGYEGLGRSCILRFTVGTATADVTIQQYGMI